MRLDPSDMPVSPAAFEPPVPAPDAPADSSVPATLPLLPNDGTPDSACGVAGVGDPGAPEPVTSPVRGATLRSLLILVLLSLSLLGQGEECRVDPRFVSPSATLNTFWEAMRSGDAEGVWECFVEGRHDLPVPGMLWFLPPTERLSIAELRSLPVTSGRVLVTYEVRYVPRGMEEERSFRTGDELVRMRGLWRIARPIGQVSMPLEEPAPRMVDI